MNRNDTGAVATRGVLGLLLVVVLALLSLFCAVGGSASGLSLVARNGGVHSYDPTFRSAPKASVFMDDIRFRAVSGHHDYGYDTTPGEAPNRAASPSGLATPTQNGFGYRPTNLGSMLSPVAPVVGAEDGPSFMDKVRGLTYDEQGGARPWSISQRLRAAGPSDEFGLPTQGRIRFVPEEGYNPLRPLPRGPNGGYIDRFGNEWVVGPSRTPGQPFEWNLQLSRTGQAQLGWLSPDENMAHINVSPLGEVTH